MDPPSPCTTPVPSVPAPPVPPRSTARSQPMYASGSMPGQQSMHLLPVEMPLALEPSHMEDTPSLSSGSSSDSGSPERFKKEPLPQAQKFSRESFFKGHKSKKSADATGKDPLRIRDGVEAKPSHAGVYTPETFPGPTPSPVIQTTPTINSYSFWATSPTSYFGGSSPNSAGPSRNTSYSSTASSTLRTPDASGFSFVKGKTLEHLRRFSNQIAAYGSGNHSTTSLAPTSARDSYFTDSSSITRHSRQSSFGPTTPTSFTRPWTGTAGNGSPNSGLGIGFPTDFVHGKTGTGYLLPEQMVQISDKSAGTIQFDESGEIIGISGHQLHNSPPAKGKRKPVPQALDNALPDDFDRLEVAEEVHAL